MGSMLMELSVSEAMMAKSGTPNFSFAVWDGLSCREMTLQNRGTIRSAALIAVFTTKSYRFSVSIPIVGEIRRLHSLTSCRRGICILR